MRINIILIFIFFFWGIECLSAQDKYNSAQVHFRNDINQFLKEEGYAPTINTNTGAINFKMEGTNYVISLAPEYKSPFLITLSATFNLDPLSDSERANLFEIENTLNSKYDCVKVSYFEYDNTYLLIFSIEGVCHNSDDFKYALAKYLTFIKSAIRGFENIYEASSSSNNSSSKRINTPYYTTTSSNTSCKITSIDVSFSEIRVNFECTNRYTNWCNINKDTYILCNTGQKYTLVRAEGIPLAPEKYTFDHYGQKITFTLVFSGLPSNIRQFDLIEPNSDWKFYNIKL